MPYTMIIIKRKKARKKKKALLPHERYIGFATNDPAIDPDSYSKRWGMETGYRMIENANARTHSKNSVVRLLCFVFSSAIYNSWVMANAMLAWRNKVSANEPLITQQQLKDLLLYISLFVDCRLLPEPPPPVLP